MSGISWVFEIFDKATSPLKSIGNELGKVDKALGAARAPMQRYEHGLGQLNEAHATAGHHSQSFWTTFRHGLEVFYFGKEVLRTLGEGVRELADIFVAGVGGRQKGLIAFEALTGSRDKAKEIFEDIEHFAFATGQSVQSVMAMTKDMMSGGISFDDTRVLRQTIGDLNAIDPSKGAALSEIVSDIGRQGFLAGRQLNTLRGIIQTNVLRKELGATFGMVVPDLGKMGDMAFRADGALKAIVETVRKTYGQGLVGGVLKKDAATLPAAIARVKQIPELLASALAGTREGIDSPITSILNNVARALDPSGDTGREILGSLGDLVDAIGNALGFVGSGLLKRLSGPEGPRLIADVFKEITESVKASLPVLQQAGEALMQIAKVLAWAAPHLKNLMQFGQGPALTPQEISGGPMAADQAERQARKDADSDGFWLWGQDDFIQRRKQDLMAGQGQTAQHVHHFSPTINVQAQTREDADFIKKTLKEQLADAFEQHVLQIGTATGGP